MNQPSSWNTLYVMAAKGIQGFILQGDKLRLMIGGSELVEALPDDLVVKTLTSLGAAEAEYKVLTKSAGGVRILFRDRSQADQLAKLLPCAITFYAPGLEVVQAIVDVKTHGFAEALDAAEKKLAARRNVLQDDYPLAGPLVKRCPRSGKPAVGWFRQGAEKEPADASMLAKDKSSEKAGKRLIGKVLPTQETADGKPRKPVAETMDHIAAGENTRIALIHVDGNGLGDLVIDLVKDLGGKENDAAIGIYSSFSKAIEEATRAAMQRALLPIMTRCNESGPGGYYPFRPLVCAGDDVTLITSAGDAMPFVSAYLSEFEKETDSRFAKINHPLLSGRSLTAAAGIVYMNKSFPFAQAYELCESLCKFAKDGTNRKASAVAFWRQTTAVANTFDDVVEKELTTRDARLTMMPYVTGRNSITGMPTLERLRILVDCARKLPRGSLRGIIGDLYISRDKAERSLERLLDVARLRQKRHGREEDGAGIVSIDQALMALTGQERPGLFTREKPSTPLHDALELLAAERN